jgi:hypothetical protein
MVMEHSALYWHEDEIVAIDIRRATNQNQPRAAARVFH